MIELIFLLLVFIWAVGYISEKQHDDIKEEIKKLNDKIMNIDNPLITQLTDIEDNGSGLKVIPMTDEEWRELCVEKPHYSDDENIQKKFEFAVKRTGIGRVLSAMCKEFNDESLKRFIEKYFEENQMWTDYMEH